MTQPDLLKMVRTLQANLLETQALLVAMRSVVTTRCRLPDESAEDVARLVEYSKRKVHSEFLHDLELLDPALAAALDRRAPEEVV